MFRFALAFCAGAAAVHALPALWRGEAVAAIAVLGLVAARRQPLAAAMLAGFAWTQLLAALWLALRLALRARPRGGRDSPAACPRLRSSGKTGPISTWT